MEDEKRARQESTTRGDSLDTLIDLECSCSVMSAVDMILPLSDEPGALGGNPRIFSSMCSMSAKRSL